MTFDAAKVASLEQNLEFELGEDEQPERLDVFLSRKMPYLSRTRIQKLIRERQVTLHGRATRGSRKIQLGESVHVQLRKTHRAKEDRTPLALNVLYEDEALLAIDKPSGIPVHPVGDFAFRTILTALHLERGPGISLVHRLDRGTSGVLLLSKTREAHRVLARDFERGQVRKTYRTVVEGVPNLRRADITHPMAPAPTERHPWRMGLAENGKEARTTYRVLQICESANRSLLGVRLHTGRKHQIRVHLSASGHPILGDDVYGGLEASRLALHAHRITFGHPLSGREMTVVAPYPKDLWRLTQPAMDAPSIDQRVLALPGANG